MENADASSERSKAASEDFRREVFYIPIKNPKDPHVAEGLKEREKAFEYSFIYPPSIRSCQNGQRPDVAGYPARPWGHRGTPTHERCANRGESNVME